MVAPKTAEEYALFYKEYNEKAMRYHADTTRNDYPAQLWYETNRNEISLSMLGEICTGKDLIDLGAAHWVERALLSKLKTHLSVKLDIAPPKDEADIIRGDACSTGLPDASFDVVICRELIEHVLDADLLMKEIVRLLRPKGYLFLNTPNAFGLPPDAEAHVRGYTPRSFQQLVERFGFEVIDKRGNCPGVFLVLMPLAEMGYNWALDEFKEIASVIKGKGESYYTGTNMFILARKKGD